MNYGDLKTQLATDSARTDLTTEIPGFIRRCEGLIRRELQAMSITTTLDESDRVSGGTYTLPTGLQQIRSISTATGSPALMDVALEKVSLYALRGLSTQADPWWFAERDANNVEIRGTPDTDTVFTIEYLGYPTALSDDSDTNSLLTNHESLYIEGSLYYLFKRTQDRELANDALDNFYNVLNKLNEQYGRKHGGASIGAAYNFNGKSSY